jgi:hypothetical protein
MSKTDATATLGTIITETGLRDAVHVAIFSVEAGEYLHPGDHVGLLSDGVTACRKREPIIGIVDPFLPDSLEPGECFWLYLYPRTVTGLQHVWQHPAFDKEEMESDSEKWLKDFIASSDCPGYNTVIRAACSERDKQVYDDDDVYGYNEGNYIHFNGADAHGEIPDEFWTHLEIITGKKFGPDKRAKYFSCSC